MSYTWLKLPLSFLDNPDIATLPGDSWRRYIEALMIAKVTDAGGFLPPVRDMAFRLRIDPDTLSGDLSRLALVGLVELRLDDAGNERWYVAHFQATQGAATNAQRVASHRSRQHARRAEPVRNDDVTERYTDKTTDLDIDLDGDQQQHVKAGNHAAVDTISPVRALLESCGVSWNRTAAELDHLPLAYVATVCRQASERRPGNPPGWILSMLRDGVVVYGPEGNMGADEWKEWEIAAYPDELDYWQRPPFLDGQMTEEKP